MTTGARAQDASHRRRAPCSPTPVDNDPYDGSIRRGAWPVARGVRRTRGLLHVPNHDLPAVLAAVRAVLRPGGLFFTGVWGGNESAEGPIDGDEHVPPRFFSRRTDEQLLGFAAGARFDVVDFHRVDTGCGYWFQSLTLRRPNPE
jgi:SAM-dependent methyltransferase